MPPVLMTAARSFCLREQVLCRSFSPGRTGRGCEGSCRATAAPLSTSSGCITLTGHRARCLLSILNYH